MNRSTRNFHASMKSQGGFTLIEIAVVMIVMLTLIAGVASTVWTSKEDAQVQLVKQFALKDAPTALTSHMTRTGTANGITKADLVARNLKSTTEWEANWTLSGPVAGVVTFTYPMTGAQDQDVTGQAIATHLSNIGGFIESATYTSPNLIFTIRTR